MMRDSYVVFSCGDMVCALPRAAVTRLLPLPELARPPGLPDVVAGVLDLAGEALPVIDLRRLLQGGGDHAAPGLYAHIMLVLGPGGRRLAVLTDRVLDVMSHATPRAVASSVTLNGCVEAEIDRDGGPAHLLAPERLLLEAERQALDDLADAAQRRLDAWRAPA